MKVLGVATFLISLFGLCLLSGVHVPPARADLRIGEVTNLGPRINAGAYNFAACISPDSLELYFCSDCDWGYGAGDIWVATRDRVEDPWGWPVNLGPEVNSSGWDRPGSISADGLTLYLACDGELYSTGRTAKHAQWGPRVGLGPALLAKTGYINDSPVVSADGLELFFASRAGSTSSSSPWVSTRPTPSDPWGLPKSLSLEFGLTGNTWPTWISPDGLQLLLWSDCPGGVGSYSMWMATGLSNPGSWSPARYLGPSVNSAYGDMVTAISPDGKWCYLSDYLGVRRDATGRYDLWQAPIMPIVDLNHDEIVDTQDLLMLIDHWGQAYPQCDIGPMPWGDGKVDAADLEILMSFWGQEFFDPALIAYWRLDESEGGVAADSLGTSPGILMGDPVWRPTGGRIGGALQFDGESDYMVAGQVLNLAEQAYSVCAWVKGGAPGQVILSENCGANWLMTDATTGALSTELKARSGGKTLSSTKVITDGQWHRVGLVRDNRNRLLYVDGVQVAEDVQDSIAASTNGLILGAGSGQSAGTFWSGLIDDVRIYDRAVKP
jgi:hypothetical protein